MNSLNDKAESFVHEVEWTDETISRFWDSEAISNEGYFSSFATPSLIRIIHKNVKLSGARLLDYGCGNGYFLSRIIQDSPSDTSFYGCDVSADSVKITNDRDGIRKNSKFYGAKVLTENNTLPYPDSFFDVITCFEVVEHLKDDILEKLFCEFGRVLKKEGVLIITTPNNEDLEAATVICPECGCKYHRYQHVRKWTPETLTRKLVPYVDVEKVYQMKINPSRYHEVLSDIYCFLHNSWSSAPNLVWIGKRKL